MGHCINSGWKVVGVGANSVWMSVSIDVLRQKMWMSVILAWAKNVGVCDRR